MRNPALARRAEELAAQGAAFVTATVVRAQRPTSAHAGDVALITTDGTIDGFVGGICAEHSVRLFAWSAMQKGEPLLLRILPTVDEESGGTTDLDDGSITVKNTCLSGGAIEVFLEPTLPVPRVNLVGSKPIAAAIERLGAELDLDIVATQDEPAQVRSGDLAMIVAAHGKGELEAIRAALEAELPYVGLVASPKRGKALLAELREAGVPDEQVDRVVCPAGLDLGAKMPAEVAVSILAQVIQTRYGGAYSAPIDGPVAAEQSSVFATDPICGMTVPAEPATPHVVHDGETIYFCREACKLEYEAGLADPTGAAAKAKLETAVDPICGMTVVATEDTPHVEHDGETIYFCCDGCKAEFQQEHRDAVAAG